MWGLHALTASSKIIIVAKNFVLVFCRPWYHLYLIDLERFQVLPIDSNVKGKQLLELAKRISDLRLGRSKNLK